jgi:predicted outer membrane repeat protein
MLSTTQTTENVDFNGVSCTLTSIDPNDPCVVAATIIDANGSGTVVTFDSNEDANAVLTGFTITGGYNSSVNGGGIYCYSTSPTINNCVVEDNYAYFGGGMGSVGGNPTITGCTFLGNEASWGAGMWSQQGNPTVTSCTFSDNSASFRGGGIFVFEGGATTTNCTFIRNSSTLEGGGMHQLESTSTVKDCLFHHNTANGGGGLYNDSSDLTVANCVFSSNSALRRGGGIHNYSNNATGDTTLTNCTFVNNSATNDDPTRGAYGGGMSNYNFGSLTVTNCIFWDNCADDGWDEIYNQYRDPNLSYCDVEGCGGSGPGWDPNIGNDDGNNIDADPCLVDANDPNGPDDIWATIDDGLQLGSGSPCIDAADNDAITQHRYCRKREKARRPLHYRYRQWHAAYRRYGRLRAPGQRDNLR